MIRRYPCQVVILSILGILAAKGAWICREGAGSQGLFLTVPALVAGAVFAKICIARESIGRKKLRQAVVLLLAFGIGMARMYVVSETMARQLAGIQDGQEVSVQGKVTKKQAKETQHQTIQWTACLTDSYLETSQGIRSCGDIILYFNQKSGEPVIGNTIIVSGKAKLFNEARNDGNFDERAYYQDQGYSLKIYAGKGSVQVVDSSEDRLREFLHGLQQKLVQVYQCSMPEQEAGTICAMLLGEKSLLPDSTKELYRQSGIAHILAISGLHISILGAAVFQLLRKRGISYAISASVSMGLLALFGLMVGMGVSTMRAVTMFGIYLGAACCGRAYDSVNGLAVAAAYILIQNPRSLFLAGFQFSFAAVAGVLLGKEICQACRPKYRLVETVLVSMSIQALTLPLTAWYYYEVPVYSVLLNMLVLPLMGAVLILGLLGGAFGLMAMGNIVSRGMLYVCALLLRYFSKAGGLFLGFPGAMCITGRPGTWQMVGYYLLLAGCVSMLVKIRQTESKYNSQRLEDRDRGRSVAATVGYGSQSVEAAAGYGSRSVKAAAGDGGRSVEVAAGDGRRGGQAAAGDGRKGGQATAKYGKCKFAFGACFGICLCVLFIHLPAQAAVVVLDVGQGDGIYIHTSDGMNVMVDGGSTDVKQVGSYRILPFLKSHGIAGIDYWFVSHLDQDHISGFMEIVGSGYPIGEVVLSKDVQKDEAYEKMMELLSECQLKVRYLEKGDALRGQNASFRCLSPKVEEASDGRNAKSLVLLYEDGGFSGFFSGDISQKEERQLLADGDLGRVDFYKAAHHGSKYSNSRELLERLKPAVCVISCSKENDYGHPGKEAVWNMETYGGSVGYTMQSGQVTVIYKI